MSRNDLIAVVRKILVPDTSERERLWYLDFMGRNTSHPAVSDLIYWPGHDGEVLAEDVVDQALAYTPIVIVPPRNNHGRTRRWWTSGYSLRVDMTLFTTPFNPVSEVRSQ
ncbi:MAG: bacteriocin immunity protein [Verrucomicrobiales bacterium]|nr:bacteriocin immunity protein [Verrucomicrobiales bacterium]